MKYNLIALACAVLLAAGLSLTVTAGPTEPDTDGDTVCDESDDCIALSNTAQYDSDKDGYGNRCDGDYDNNGKTDLVDFATFKAAFLAYQEQADHQCSGKVDLVDFATFKSLFGPAAGPSGLACAGPKNSCTAAVGCP